MAGLLIAAFLVCWSVYYFTRPVYHRLLVLPVTFVYQMGERNFTFRLDGDRLIFGSRQSPRFEADLTLRPVTSNLPFMLAVLAVLPGELWRVRSVRVAWGWGFLGLSHVLFLVTKIEISLVEAGHRLAGPGVLWRAADDFFEITGKALIPLVICLGLGYRDWLRGAPARVPIPVASGGGGSRNQPCPCGSGLKFKRCCGRQD